MGLWTITVANGIDGRLTLTMANANGVTDIMNGQPVSNMPFEGTTTIVDRVAPLVTSFTPDTPSPGTNAGYVSFHLTFTEPVTISNSDVELIGTATSGANIDFIANQSGSTDYYVGVFTGPNSGHARRASRRRQHGDVIYCGNAMQMRPMTPT